MLERFRLELAAGRAGHAGALNNAARTATLWWLAGQLSDQHRVSWHQAFHALISVPLNLGCMLDSADGVTALGAIAATQFPEINPEPFIAKAH